MMRTALALLAVVAVGCGGRSKMIGPRSPSPTGQESPDAAPLPTDVRPGADAWLPQPQPDALSRPEGLPPVTPDVARDLRPTDLPTDRLPVLPPDVLPPRYPDAPPDGRPPIAPPDGPPPVAPPDGPPFVVPPDGPPLVAPPDGPPFVAPPDVRPDVRPPRPDTLPPAVCASGAACTANCTTTCQTIGTMTCTCDGGFLSCGQCQVPPITISPQPCPDNPRGAACAPAGLVCMVYSGGSVSGGCLCTTRGNSNASRWTCIMR